MDKCKHCEGAGYIKILSAPNASMLDECVYCRGTGNDITVKNLPKKKIERISKMNETRMRIIEDSLRFPGNSFKHKWIQNTIHVECHNAMNVNRLVTIITQMNKRLGKENRIICEITGIEPYTFKLKI